MPSTLQVRDHMYRAIQDYLCSGRCEWMQKWPGMCVLNASQLHWTSETEELLLEQGGEAPQTMLTRQVGWLCPVVVVVEVVEVTVKVLATKGTPVFSAPWRVLIDLSLRLSVSS